ncbi:alpha/beta hydrolase fold protein [Annulohypoxylon maeteangense]|uniref:alpha/beta hydrolase fold protein n=1 Tax=Annulohypoxylon maeteangense TaxID=1927788 RepID=UPI002008E5AF|nr:alpha/beta hydrolase fold protein [Annulohypoxylon maeteangense]KAI0885820.1 alpha/beta hydrolase fold protein [Annulohypoxylon maeteangense]
MGSNEVPSVVNPLHPSIVDKVDPIFAEIYNRYQAPQLRADQVPYEVYNKDRPKYTFPTAKVSAGAPDVASNTIYKIPVSNPSGEIAIQVYVPTPDAIASGGLEKDGLLPALVNFHGGGFVIGGLESDESFCRTLCQRLGSIIVNVDYRLAPEYPHPVSATDSWEALKWTFGNAGKLKIDPSRVAVSGLSAGGCIAAVLALLARDEPSVPNLVAQVLIVPVIDARYIPTEGSCDPAKTPYKSYVDFEFAPMLPLHRLVWFYNLWIGTDESRAEKANDFRASPIVAESHANLAPAIIRCAEIDPLVSEGIAYHEKLTAAGTPSKLKIYKGQGHPFGHWDGANPTAKEFVSDCISELRAAFATK